MARSNAVMQNTQLVGRAAMRAWRPGWWDRETAAHQEFAVNTLGFRDSVLTINLSCSGHLVPREFELASGENFWQEVVETVLDICPGSERSCGHYLDLDDDLCMILPTDLNHKATEDLLQQLSAALESKAQTRWLRPGVPKLSILVRRHLLDRKALLEGIVGFQHKHGYKETKQLLDQYSDALLCEDLSCIVQSSKHT